MSNDVLKDGFFADKEISASEKLALCALSLGGTYSEQVTQDGRNTVLFSMVYKKSGEITQISDAIIGSTMKGNMPTINTLKRFEITIDNCIYYQIFCFFDTVGTRRNNHNMVFSHRRRNASRLDNSVNIRVRNLDTAYLRRLGFRFAVYVIDNRG